MASHTFQPWSLERSEPLQLKDILSRVNLERGHFRDITEASLQEEIAADGGLSTSPSDSEDEEDDDAPAATTTQPASREDLFKARAEMAQQVASAREEVMTALDMVSLLQTEHAPVAEQTMSPTLKQRIPPKSFGTDIWQRMPEDTAKQAKDETLAYNVRMRGLQQGADSILGAAKRLEDNVRKETQFWEQMLSISEKGWSICRIPRSNRLGVRYGFSESRGEFSGRSLAALNESSDGSISLERGFGAKPQGLRVSVTRGGQTVGKSYLPALAEDSETTLESRIRHARDSIFDEELFREATLESRMMASLGVYMTGNTIRIPSPTALGDTASELHMELRPLAEETGAQINPANPDDVLAQAVAISARLLLTQAHRERSQKRSAVPPPLSDRKEETAVLPILRPTLSFLMQRTGVSTANVYLARLASLLSAAKIGAKHLKARLQLPTSQYPNTAAALTSSLKDEFVSEAKLNIELPDSAATFAVKISTTLALGYNAAFTLTLPAGKSHRFDGFERLSETCDAELAYLLARSLGVKAGEGWKLEAQEALLSKDVGVDETLRHVWVAVDSAASVLTQASLENKVVWRLEGESSGESFWDAWDELK